MFPSPAHAPRTGRAALAAFPALVILALAPAVQAAPIGSHLLKTVAPATDESDGIDTRPRAHVEFGGRTLFSVGDDARRPWVTDGTRAGTQPIAALGSIREMNDAAAFDGGAVFADDELELKPGLWFTDGTAAGTRKILPGGSTAPLGASVSRVVVAGGAVYYRSADPAVPGAGRLFRTDASGPGVRVQPAALPASAQVRELATLGDALIFSAVEDSGAGERLWRLDTTTGVALELSAARVVRRLDRSFVAGGRLYFIVQDAPTNSATSAEQVWVTDGTPAGTKMLPVTGLGTGAVPAPTSLLSDGSTVFAITPRVPTTRLRAITGETVTDVPSGAALRLDSTGTGTVANAIRSLAAMGTALFVAQDGSLVRVGADGRSAVVRDFGTDRELSPNAALTPIHGRLYFGASTQSHGQEPWVSDGTATGTEEIDDIADGSGEFADFVDSSPSGFLPAGGRVAFKARTQAGGGTDLFATGPDPDPLPTPVVPGPPAISPPSGGEPTAPLAPAAPTASGPGPAGTGTNAPVPVAGPPAPVPVRIDLKVVKVKQAPKRSVVTLAGGLRRASGTGLDCSGGVALRITAKAKAKKKGGKARGAKPAPRTVATAQAPLRPGAGACTFQFQVTVSRGAVAAGAKVEAIASTPASGTRQAASSTPVRITLR